MSTWSHDPLGSVICAERERQVAHVQLESQVRAARRFRAQMESAQQQHGSFAQLRHHLHHKVVRFRGVLHGIFINTRSKTRRTS